jgi:hypothetical protein
MAGKPRWFGPSPFRLWPWPVSWQGWAATVALLLGPLLINFSGAPLERRWIAGILLVAGYIALLVLTYAEDSD